MKREDEHLEFSSFFVLGCVDADADAFIPCFEFSRFEVFTNDRKRVIGILMTEQSFLILTP